jgi:hypothetical protein
MVAEIGEVAKTKVKMEKSKMLYSLQSFFEEVTKRYAPGVVVTGCGGKSLVDLEADLRRRPNEYLDLFSSSSEGGEIRKRWGLATRCGQERIEIRSVLWQGSGSELHFRIVGFEGVCSGKSLSELAWDLLRDAESSTVAVSSAGSKTRGGPWRAEPGAQKSSVGWGR